MHSYSTDNDGRPTVYGVIAIAALAVAVGVSRFFGLLGGFIPAISSISISWGLAFSALLGLYSKYGWDHWIARGLRASRVPNLSGRWEGYMGTSYDGDIPDSALHESDPQDEGMQRVRATLYIKQTWRKISIHVETASSESDSTGATILMQDGRWPSLNYQYANDPDPDAEDTMSRHYGTADLALKSNEETDVLEGFYYTGPQRENYGEMFFRRSE